MERDTPHEWNNVFHFTKGGNGGEGERIPGFWINKKRYFHVMSDINGHSCTMSGSTGLGNQLNRYDSNIYELNKAYHFKIMQR